MADSELAQVHAGEPMSGADRRWNRDYEAWRRARLDRVQASARVWLGVLTTILGLLGSVVLFKGGSLVTGVTGSGWLQLALIFLIGLVFAAAVLAVIAGGVATWGGLKDRESPSQAGEYGSAGTGTAPAALGGSRRWQRPLLQLVLVVAGTPKDEQKAAMLAFEPTPEQAAARHAMSDWQWYQNDIVMNANRNRIYLHASRILGVIAAAAIAVLAIVAVIAGTVAPVPPVVIVVNHGRVSCGPVKKYATANGVTQVIAVSNC